MYSQRTRTHDLDAMRPGNRSQHDRDHCVMSTPLPRSKTFLACQQLWVPDLYPRDMACLRPVPCRDAPARIGQIASAPCTFVIPILNGLPCFVGSDAHPRWPRLPKLQHGLLCIAGRRKGHAQNKSEGCLTQRIDRAELGTLKKVLALGLLHLSASNSPTDCLVACP